MTPPTETGTLRLKRVLVVTTAVVCICVLVLVLQAVLWRAQRGAVARGDEGVKGDTHSEQPGSKDQVATAIDGTLRNLRGSNGRTPGQRQLEGLRRFFQDIPTPVAAAGIQEFLNSKANSASHS